MTPDEAARRRDELLQAVQAEDQLMLKVAEAIPEDRIAWRPEAEKARQANALAMHAAAVGTFFTQVVEGTADMSAEPPPPPTDKATLLAAIRGVQQQFQARVAAYSPEHLAAETEFFGGKYANVDILSWHRDHMIHHRGQLALYLRLMGAKVPSTYGPSGDEEYAPESAPTA